MNRFLSQMLVGACFAALAGASAAQTFRGGELQKVADTKSVPTQAGGDTTTPPAPATHKSHATHSASSKHAQHHTHAKTASHKKSTSHATKSTAKANANASTAPAAPVDSAYRQALRGCATEQDQARRDSCLNGAIEKFQPNT